MCGTSQRLFVWDVDKHNVYHYSAARLSHGNSAPRAAIELLRAEIFLRDFKTPIAESALGNLHNVPLVNEGHALAPVLDRIGNRAVHQTHTSRATHRLVSNANADLVAFLRAHLFPTILS